jgi:hypothetical protein
MTSENGGEQQSGSDKIREAFGNGGLISEERHIAWLGRIEYGELLSVWIRGQPNPDRFGGVIEIQADREGDFVDEALEHWDPPFKLQFLTKGSCIAFSYPDGQPSVEAIPDKR